VEAGASPGRDGEEVVALLAVLRAGKAPTAAVEAGAPHGQDGEKMEAPLAAQEASKMPPTAEEATRQPRGSICPVDLPQSCSENYSLWNLQMKKGLSTSGVQFNYLCPAGLHTTLTRVMQIF
jgi:hypothetical protein